MIVYIAGPYRGKSKIKIINKLQVIRNILNARKVAKELWAQGVFALCPHMNTGLLDGVAPDEVFLQGDIEMLAKCDYVVLVKGWQESSGTRNEIIFANHAGIPVYRWDYKSKKLDGWYRVVLAKKGE